MSALHGMSANDSHLIGFVASCLWRSAITTAELRAWCDRIIAAREVGRPTGSSGLPREEGCR